MHHSHYPDVGKLRQGIIGAGLLLLIWTAGNFSVAHAASLCVGGGGCYATIQQAVTAAASGDMININAGTYTEHDIALNKNLTLKGASAATTIVNANQVGRAFTIGAGVQVTIRDLTIQNGKVQNDNGGAINNAGTLNVIGSTFATNRVEGSVKGGGAIYSKGTLIVASSVFTGNLHTGTMTGPAPYPPAPNGDGAFGGGAILGDGAINVDASTFNANLAEPIGLTTGSGGAIHSRAAMIVTNSTFDQNIAGCGGAVDLGEASTGTISASTFTKNRGMH